MSPQKNFKCTLSLIKWSLHTHVKYVDKHSKQKTFIDHLNAGDCNLTSFIISKLHFPVSNAKMVTSLSKTGQCHHYMYLNKRTGKQMKAMFNRISSFPRKLASLEFVHQINPQASPLHHYRTQPWISTYIAIRL